MRTTSPSHATGASASTGLAPARDARGEEQGGACRRESLRLEANKAFAESMLRMSDNPVLAAREYARFARDLNTAINVHNAVCKRYPVSLLPL